MATRDYDVIAAEVHRKALENLTQEMAITLVRTSGSPIVTDAKDFSTCLMDRKPEHLGFAAYVLFHLGSSLIGTQVIEELVAGGHDLRPGDGWVVNDPHTGGAMHQGDVSIIMPTFYKGEHLGWSFANMHVLDVGGVGISGYAPGAHDVWQEGMLFPPVRIIRDGAIDQEWEHYIAANVRAPGPVLNDIRSMIAANNTANTKLNQIVDEFGLEAHQQYCEINKDLSEQVLRERIAKIPDGVYEAVDWNEFDGHDGPDHLLELRLKMEVDGSTLRLNYSGVPQVDAFVNSAKGAMYGSAMTGLMTMLTYGDLPINGGIWRPVEVDLGEPGTIVNSVPPAPVSNAHSEVGMRACKLVKDVLNQALSLSDDPVLRGRVAGQCVDGFPANALFGANQHGGTSVIFYIDNASGAGGGAQSIQDGQDSYGLTCMTGCGIADVEVHEAADPVLFLWRRLVANSGGPGQMRGGQSLDQAYAIHYSDSMAGPGFNACAEVPPRGFGGGYPASAGDWHPVRGTNVTALLQADRLATPDRLEGVHEEARNKVTHLSLGRDDVFIARSGGGGGLGDPLLRSVETVFEDLDAGYVTPAHARAIYGVVLDDRGALDEAATAARRKEILRERIGGEPERELREPASVGVAVVRDNGSWACGSCAETLAPSGDNWRQGNVVMAEYGISERYAELEMRVRARTESPKVVLREHFCPSCAHALGVDVVTDDLETLPSPQVGVGAGVPA
ncbi:hydantoinase B/oxoprolinase family protein [Baekduia soli]|uniref:Hydantoinase B/oxoprolinase family protein n=1 Tax=Baekduia soli TaxID=496014 RepID=A0A5B8U0D6_9ACTN|nr:hydantoinase B/oxoprolinase family protein [Baekduia soli]QEC46479.1 hydantoinase B/oxoprolinase family protein [Baekduia soli]